MNVDRDPVGAVRRCVARHLQRSGFPAASRLVAAVSGGPDSTVMLDALVAEAPAAGIGIVVAHFHHGIRGPAADLDAAFVADLAARYGVPFQDGEGDARGHARAHGLSLEDAARRLRRRFLETVRRESAAAAIALGHNRDDQAETVLLNLLRGAGPRGLGAMPEYGPGFITRPLIRVRRPVIEAYAAALQLPFRTDETNVDVTFTRNRVRHELIPLLQRDFNPRLIEALATDAGLFREIDSFLTRSARSWLNDPATADHRENRLRLDVARLKAEPPALIRAILREATRKVAGTLLGWEKVHFDALFGLVRRHGAAHLDLPGGTVAERNGGAVEIRKDEGFPRIRTEAAAAGIFPTDTAAAAPPPPLVLEIASGYEAGWAGARIRVTILDLPPGTARIPAGDRSAWFDADQFEGSTLLIRSPQPGDRIRLFGSGGRRKLSDIFIDRKVPRARRRRWPVITQTSAAGEEILWVVGIVRSAGAIVTGETRRVVQLEAFGLWK